MDTIKINNNNYIEIRNSTWDSNTFNYNVYEITKIIYDSEESINQLFLMLDTYCKEKETKLLTVRINAQDYFLKLSLQEKGFLYIETICEMILKNLSKYNFLHLKKPLSIEIPNDEDFSQISNIAHESFNFSKYHENYKIDLSLANKRMRNWVNDLKNKRANFLIYKQQQKVISFVAYEVENKIAHLIIGGSKSEYGFITFHFWNTFLEKFKNEEIKAVKTIVSAANIGSMHLHTQANFSVHSTKIGFAKHYVN